MVAVKFASMDGRDAWRWKRGRGSNAVRPNDDGVLSVFVEAVRKGTVLRVPLRVDARRLRKDWMKPRPRSASGASTARNWEHLLRRGLEDAARLHGQRVLEPELRLWRQSRKLDAAAEAMATPEARAKDGEAVFPIGWGIGWRGMTGAALERLDGDAASAARAGDANATDPALIRDARGSYARLVRGASGCFPSRDGSR